MELIIKHRRGKATGHFNPHSSLQFLAQIPTTFFDVSEFIDDRTERTYTQKPFQGHFQSPEGSGKRSI